VGLSWDCLGTVSGLSRDCLFSLWEIANGQTPSKSMLGWCHEKWLPITIKTVPDRAMPHLHLASCTQASGLIFSSICHPIHLTWFLSQHLLYIPCNASFPPDWIALLCCVPPALSPLLLSVADLMDCLQCYLSTMCPIMLDGLSRWEKCYFSGRLETRGNGFSEKRVYSQTYILNLLKRQEYRKYLLIY
jgi:hypothetical protein